MAENKGPNKWLALTTISTQMIATIYLCYLLGDWLDSKYPNTSQLWMKICTMFGVVISLYQVVKQVNRLNEK